MVFRVEQSQLAVPSPFIGGVCAFSSPVRASGAHSWPFTVRATVSQPIAAKRGYPHWMEWGGWECMSYGSQVRVLPRESEELANSLSPPHL
jgi:hypothetical protein